jgi:hypothetical protein
LPAFESLALFDRAVSDKSPATASDVDRVGRPSWVISGSHSILVAPGEHLAPMVIRAARLAAILLRIARGLRHEDNGSARL